MKSWAIAQTTFRQALHDKTFQIVGCFTLIVGALALVPGRTSAGSHGILADAGLTLIQIFGSICALLLGSSLVHRDIELRTTYLVLSKPVSRARFLLARFVGLLLTLTLLEAAMAIVLGGALAVVSGRLAGAAALLTALTIVWLSTVLVAAMATAFSVVTSPVVSAIYTAGLLFMGLQASAIRDFGSKASAWIHWTSRLYFYLAPNFSTVAVRLQAAYGDRAGLTAWGWAALYLASYTAAVLALACTAFRNQEL